MLHSFKAYLFRKAKYSLSSTAVSTLIWNHQRTCALLWMCKWVALWIFECIFETNIVSLCIWSRWYVWCSMLYMYMFAQWVAHIIGWSAPTIDKARNKNNTTSTAMTQINGQAQPHTHQRVTIITNKNRSMYYYFQDLF